jgi:hypothetical protein
MVMLAPTTTDSNAAIAVTPGDVLDRRISADECPQGGSHSTYTLSGWDCVQHGFALNSGSCPKSGCSSPGSSSTRTRCRKCKNYV